MVESSESPQANGLVIVTLNYIGARHAGYRSLGLREMPAANAWPKGLSECCWLRTTGIWINLIQNREGIMNV
jgi:hypothetical protein